MSDEARLSDEQIAVVEAEQADLVVQAAAGAGKTRVLVERYLRSVREGVPPDAILTITFTRKAAAEMKERIVRALVAEGRSADAQIAETGPIQTIHAFCHRMLRENALEAGLDPDVEILAESAASRLVEDAIEQALAHPPEGQEVEDLIVTLAGRRSPYEASSAHARLKGAVRRVLTALRGSGLAPAEIEDSHASSAATQELYAHAVLEALDSRVAALYDGATAPLDPDALRSAFKSAGIAQPRWLRRGSLLDSKAASDACGLVKLACAAWRWLDSTMEVRQAFDFAGLEARAVDLLAQSQATRRRLQGQYRTVLVDEAQDVNPVQYALLDSIRVPIMLVGDPQQSIYGFRQADVRLFRDRAERIGAHRLRRNFRSEPGILGFVDALFGSLWGESYEPMGDAGELDLEVERGRCEGVEIWLQRAKDVGGVARAVQGLVAAGERPRDVAVLVRRARYGNELVDRLVALGVPARMVGGSERFFARLEVRDVANMLRALADPSDDFSLLCALRSPIVGLSMDSIAVLGSEPRAGERIHAFSAPDPEDGRLLDEFRSWFLPLRAYADRLGAWEAISELFARTSYLERLALRPDSAQRLANVRKLLRLAVDEPDLGPVEFAERIRGIQALEHKEGDAPALDAELEAVTVMTVHKAKGLEFPVVVLPDTHSKITFGARDVVVDPWLGIVATSPEGGSDIAHEWLADLQVQRERQEEMRVLYVALTRAERRLCICAHAQAPSGTLAELIGKSVAKPGREPPGLSLRELDAEVLGER